MEQPTLFSILDRYSEPLADDDRRRLFEQWRTVNAGAVETMVAWADGIAAAGEPVAVQRLFERARWEPGLEIAPVVYTDVTGKVHRYRVNHNDRALFGRWLQAERPGMRVTMRKSRYDN